MLRTFEVFTMQAHYSAHTICYFSIILPNTGVVLESICYKLPPDSATIMFVDRPYCVQNQPILQ